MADEHVLRRAGQQPGARLAPHVVGLLAAAWGLREAHENAANARGRKRRERIKDHVENHLHDPGLTASSVAADFGISPRLLRLIFNRADETLSRYILHRRLEGAASCLRDPGWRARTVTEIAMRFGFGSSTQFGIAFRKAYEMTPSEYRKRAQ